MQDFKIGSSLQATIRLAQGEMINKLMGLASREGIMVKEVLWLGFQSYKFVVKDFVVQEDQSGGSFKRWG
jgi:hypothetical protein